MNRVVEVFLILGPLAFGAGTARLMFLLLEQVRRFTPKADILRLSRSVLLWFLGNGALGFGLVKSTNATLPEKSWASLLVILAYFTGFGVVTFYQATQSETRLRFSDQEVDALLMILALGIPVAEVAKALETGEHDVQMAYHSVLKKLKDRHPRILDRISEG